MAESGDVGDVPTVAMEDKKRVAPSELDVSDLPDAKKAKVEEVASLSDVDALDEYVMEGLALYDMHRKARDTTNESSKTVSFSKLAPELTCYLCEAPFLRTYTVMECLHRFCFDCVSKYLRIGRKDCPRCGVKLPSTRFMRPDHGVDLLLGFVCPPHCRPSKSLSQETLERRIPLIAERHAAGPLTKIDELDPFYVHDGSNDPYGSRTPGTPSKKRNTQAKTTQGNTVKRGRPAKSQKIETQKEAFNAPTPPPPAPIIHTAPAVIKMAAPLPLKTTTPMPTNGVFSSTSSTASQTASSALTAASTLAKGDVTVKTEGAGLEEPHPTPTHQNLSETSISASVPSMVASTPTSNDAPSTMPSILTVNHPVHEAGSAAQAILATSTKIVPSMTPIASATTSAQPKKQRRPVGEQILVTLLPKPNAKPAIGALHKPFIIAPTSASVDYLAQLINATLKVDTPLEVPWKLSPTSDGTELLDKNMTLDWINKHYFLPHHKDILLYFFQE